MNREIDYPQKTTKRTRFIHFGGMVIRRRATYDGHKVYIVQFSGGAEQFVELEYADGSRYVKDADYTGFIFKEKLS